MKIQIKLVHVLYIMALFLCYYLYSKIDLKYNKVIKKCIDKGFVGSRSGEVHFFAVFKYNDGLIIKKDVSTESYYYYTKGKKYIEERPEIIWK